MFKLKLDEKALKTFGPTNFGDETIEVLETRLMRVVHHDNVPDNENAKGMSVYDYQYLCKGSGHIFLADADLLHEEIDAGIYNLI